MNKPQPEEEFYIGWEQKVPPLQRRFLYNRLIGIFVFVFSLAILFPMLQKRYEPSFKKSLSKGEFEGVLYLSPLPSLLVERPGTIPDHLLPASNYLLVNPHKYGIPANELLTLEGKSVGMSGSIIFNRSQTLVEVRKHSIEPYNFAEEVPPTIPEPQFMGRYNLKGIIVDSKGYYGALNPGYGKAHRATTVRSIANGVPPVLIIKSEAGVILDLMVTGTKFEPIGDQIVDRVGLPVAMTGEIYGWANKYIVKVDPNKIFKLDD
jgi:hypothetical protein